MPDDSSQIAAAVFNNAVWCDAVCQALGCDTDFVDDLWINGGTSPPFYPNAITLTRAGSEAQLRRIGLLADGGLPPEWSVKDAYAALDLGARGFGLLFEAEWLGLSADRDLGRADASDIHWERIATEPALTLWEATWRAALGDDRSREAAAPRVFEPALLDDPDIALLAGYRGDRIVAVVAGNRSDDGSGPVAGISNIVLPSVDGERHRAGAVMAVRSVFPGLDLVGYERGADLEAMTELGFDRLGALRIWIRV